MTRLERAREKDLVSVMEQFGSKPQRNTSVRAMYMSPFRSEGVPSFIVYKKSNSWYDWGTGESGDGVDLVRKMNSCSFSEAVDFLTGEKRDIYQYIPPADNVQEDHGIDILNVEEITNPYLIRYAESRAIQPHTLKAQCKQVEFAFKSSTFTTHNAVGFRNDKGGWELRNHKHKVGNSPKSWSMVRGTDSDDVCMVFEGFFDFLSYLQLNNITQPLHDTFILNSLVFIPFVIDQMNEFKWVWMYLDNDSAAQQKIDEYFTEKKYVDMRGHYKDFEDYNDYVQAELL
jgi:hypothetical protein